jgi:phage terminase large subunit GpA-like protein
MQFSEREGNTMRGIEVEVGASDDGYQPVCPHCDKELAHVKDHMSHLRMLYNLVLISCPHCHKVIGATALVK